MRISILNNLKQIAKNSSDFKIFRDNLINALYARESGSSFDFVDPYIYIDSPIQDIKISDITNADNLQARARMQVRNMKAGVQGGHGAAFDRQIDFPLAVEMTSLGTYNIIDGSHRVLQALINGDKNILAFVIGGEKGLTLQDIFNLARK